MAHPRFPIMFALAWMGVACSSSDASGPQVPEADGGNLPDAEPDSGPADGASDSGHDADDAHAPAAPSCQTG
ncbi:MAG TPA: hypothetical protein VLM85_03330, partial [Polyangiaceae bacterium]|nr:hypothetical protein [Polyangiaceae bacterium]